MCIRDSFLIGRCVSGAASAIGVVPPAIVTYLRYKKNSVRCWDQFFLEFSSSALISCTFRLLFLQWSREAEKDIRVGYSYYVRRIKNSIDIWRILNIHVYLSLWCVLLLTTENMNWINFFASQNATIIIINEVVKNDYFIWSYRKFPCGAEDGIMLL